MQFSISRLSSRRSRSSDMIYIYLLFRIWHAIYCNHGNWCMSRFRACTILKQIKTFRNLNWIVLELVIYMTILPSVFSICPGIWPRFQCICPRLVWWAIVMGIWKIIGARAGIRTWRLMILIWTELFICIVLL
jgi:hypothetical protein